MGDAALHDFKKGDTAPGLQLKRFTSLRNIDVFIAIIGWGLGYLQDFF